MWPKRIVIGLPESQSGSEVISLTIAEMSGVKRTSWTLTETSGCQITAEAVGVRLERERC